MTLDGNTTVGRIAATEPRAIRLFEQWGIDYCCGGDETLEDVCRKFGLTVREVEASIGLMPPPPEQRNWMNEPLLDVIEFIINRYHTFTREELALMEDLTKKVVDAHQQRHPELADIALLVKQLSDDLLPHMLKEEQVLFPYIGILLHAEESGTEPPMPFFGTVRNPIRKMMSEHDAAASILATLREVSGHYALPGDACASYTELYRRLEMMERLTHEHMHLENNVLFPRAVELEDRHPRALLGGACGDGCCGKH